MFQDKRTWDKKNFLGEKRRKIQPQSWDQNKGVHNQLIKPLPKHNITYWKGNNTKFLLTNIQSLIYKLDIFLHHMELANIDVGFITETWINNTTDLDSMTSQATEAGYTIISCKYTNRKGGGLMCIHKSGLNVQKVRTVSKNHLMD